MKLNFNINLQRIAAIGERDKMSICEQRRFGFCLFVAVIIALAGCKTTPPLIAYDQNLKTEIENRWYVLLAETKFPAPEKSGETVVTFKLYPDGKIDALKVETNTAPVSELVALQAIKDCTPFPKQPDDMRRMVIMDGENYREFMFVFKYYDKLPSKTAK